MSIEKFFSPHHPTKPQEPGPTLNKRLIIEEVVSFDPQFAGKFINLELAKEMVRRQGMPQETINSKTAKSIAKKFGISTAQVAAALNYNIAYKNTAEAKNRIRSHNRV